MTGPLAALGTERLRGSDKGLPAAADGLTVREFLDTEPRLDAFWTPLVVLDDEALGHNLATMGDWAGSRRLELMPHGKTTMAPALWHRQLEAGCTGITLATMGQVRAGREFGLATIMLANAVVDPRSLRYLAGELADPEFRLTCWADSPETVQAMEDGLRGVDLPRPVDVCVELGAPGGRTGARSVPAALEVARRIDRAGVLRLAGVDGYEGSLGHDRSDRSLAAVRDYLTAQVRLHEALADLYDDEGDRYVTAGGSAYFDVVADVYADAIVADPGARWTLRSGAYLTHDDGFYRTVSPLDEAGVDVERRLRPALWGTARVVSHPERGLALLDGGKRDFPYDEGLPLPRRVAADLGGPWRPLTDAAVTAMNDQHSYLTVADQDVAVGDVVALGLSHPCTTFDKWRFVPVVESATSDRVVDLVRTFF